MRLGDIIEFRKDLYFEGAVQADWFYDRQKAAKVAENFVFHGKNYYGVEGKKDSIDTVSFVKALANKIGKESENPRSLAIADYGTGKSHLAVTLGVLFSGPQFMPSTYRKVLDNIKMIDARAASDISALCKERNFVIMLNGIRDFNLHSEILKATQRSLRLYGIDDSELKKINHTIDTASRFFNLNSQSRLTDFEKAASSRGWHENGEALLRKISDSIGADDDAFEIINDVYELTTGQRIRWEEGISAKAILEMLLSRYCGLNGLFDHVIILFDEFGRFLEYASGTDGGKCGDNALQEIFEVSQNAAGALQIINFIQTDIKTYLLRVDQSRNLSRYIGRYDESEKYHISSNLETVFANLISRTNQKVFVGKIVEWQNSKESFWADIYAKLNKWTQTSGIWADYKKYRKVIVEGIYPMHPVSVFMLTQLSDYLQNRSSMNLISQYISTVSDVDLDLAVPLVIPTELMKGDLFVEMLAAETSGRHRSDYCIRFENVLKKNEQKLSTTQIDVLRANLVTRTLRFNTRNYEEAKASLMLCSGYSEAEIDDALTILVDEYAVMAFDEMSGCFDFTEDAKGAYDYKIFKRRLLAKQHIDLRSLLSTASILDEGGFTQTQATNFGTSHKIFTNEWCFNQEVILAEDMTKELAIKYLAAWKNARGVVTPKGRLIWVYVNKDTDYHTIEHLQEISALFEGTPVVMMFLNDTDNLLKNILTEYDVLDHMDENTRNAYSTIYVKDRERIRDNLRNAFDALKKKREQISANGSVQWKKRLPIALTEIFESVYPNVISYNFDGLLTSANNFTGNGAKYYCQILKMLLSNKVSFETIRDYPRDVRNRIEALFMVDNASSWKCLTKNCALVAPLNEKARNIYDLVNNELEKKEHYNCETFFTTFCEPPYGISEEAAAMFLSMFIVNQWHNIRVLYNNSRMTVTEWKDNIVEDKKLHLDDFKSTTILWVDTGSAEAKFSQLFKKINDNRNLEEAKRQEEELKSLIEFYGLPESMDVHYRLASIRFNQFKDAERIWQTRIQDIEEELNKSLERGDVNRALSAIEMIRSISPSSIFEKQNIDSTEEHKESLKSLLRQADRIIRDCFDGWLSRNVYCQSVDQMNSFERFYINCSSRLRSYGYHDFASKLEKKGEKELANKEEIKSRQELVSDGKKFLSDVKKVSPTNYIEIKSLVKSAGELEERFSKYGKGLGKEAISLAEKVKKQADALKNRKEKMDADMSSVFDIVAEAETVDGLELAAECLSTVLGYTIPEKDRTEYKTLQNLLNELTDDTKEIMAKSNDRKAFDLISEQMIKKYQSGDIDYDFIPIITDCIAIGNKAMDERDNKWRMENVTLGSKSRQEIHEWKRRIEELPAYISDETKEMIRILDMEADHLISEGKIEDVVIYFDRLDASEKRKCLDLLINRYQTNQ